MGARRKARADARMDALGHGARLDGAPAAKTRRNGGALARLALTPRPGTPLVRGPRPTRQSPGRLWCGARAGATRFSAEPRKAPTSCRAAPLHDRDVSSRTPGRRQFTDTADQAAPTARYSALPAPYRSFAALSVAVRAPAYFVDDVM